MNPENKIRDTQIVRNALRGIPVRCIWWAMIDLNKGINWHGCSKEYITKCIVEETYRGINLKSLNTIKENALQYFAQVKMRIENKQIHAGVFRGRPVWHSDNNGKTWWSGWVFGHDVDVTKKELILMAESIIETVQ